MTNKARRAKRIAKNRKLAFRRRSGGPRGWWSDNNRGWMHEGKERGRQSTDALHNEEINEVILTVEIRNAA